ncbi:MAG: hypothetical protein KAV25_09075 [Methanophagales archaeon]|nr:hypothetical protein [Methanophagales archaeon]
MERTKELIKEIQKYLPLPVYASPELCKLLRKQGKAVNTKTGLKITKVFDSGEMGGIVCSIIEENKEVFVVSLTHLKTKRDHPLSRKILEYQIDRIKRISKQPLP